MEEVFPERGKPFFVFSDRPGGPLFLNIWIILANKNFYFFNQPLFSSQTICESLFSLILSIITNNTLASDFHSTFSFCSGVTSAVPTLWISHPTAEHTQCFLSVSNASNYSSIPADWK